MSKKKLLLKSFIEIKIKWPRIYKNDLKIDN